jgi:YVTN family beta-propeller protein
MADLPSGAVTFLFTDIEGSTRLVRQLRGSYAEVLTEHQRLLREAFTKHGGHEIDTQGDAFFFAFPSAHEAVLAAIEGQRALSGYPWPNGAPVKVRMGIHTGQAAPVNGRYTGLAVHRAARICAAGHGGQVLVSQATQSLLEDEEEDLAVRLNDLGDQRLKDIDRPVRVYQVAAAGLPAEFPPLRREEEAHAPAVEPPLPLYRRRRVLLPAVAALVAALAVAAFLLTRSGGGGLSGVDANHVGVIDAETGDIVAQVPVGLRPGPVAVGAGSVWIGNLEDRTLTRVDPKTRTNAGTISLDSQTPTGVAVGAGGVWVAHGILGTLSRVDPGFRTLDRTIEVAGRSNNGVVTVGEGAVWVVYGESTLARVTPREVRVAGESFAGNVPTAIVFAADSVWVANGGQSSLYQFNPSTFEQGEVDEIGVGRTPRGIAYEFDSLWVANNGSDTVTRVDVASKAQDSIDVGNEPSGIAVGGGSVWVANSGDGTVSRIDPATNDVVDTIEIGNVPDSLSSDGDFVWVTVQAPTG